MRHTFKVGLKRRRAHLTDGRLYAARDWAAQLTWPTMPGRPNQPQRPRGENSASRRVGWSRARRPEDVEAIRGAQEPGRGLGHARFAVVPNERAGLRADSDHAVVVVVVEQK